MSRFVLPALILLSVPALLAPTVQKRVKEQEAKDFPTLISEATSQWNEKRYGGCIAALQEAVVLATTERVTAIRGALPNPPTGWEQLPDKKNNAQNAAGLAALGAVAGNIVDRKWKATEGRSNLAVSVTADSPLVGMLGGYITNPAMLGEGKELIEYGTHKAILETQKKGSRLKLQIIIAQKHIVDVTANGMTEDELFAMWNQEAVDRLASALNY